MKKQIRFAILLFISIAAMLSCSKGLDGKFKNVRIMIGPNNKWAYVKEVKEQWINLTDFIYDDARDFQQNGVAWVRYNGKYALINTDFEFMSDFYDEMSIYVEEELIGVANGGKYGFIDSDGEVAIDIIYPKINFVVQSGKYVSVSNDKNKWALLDENNEAVIDFKYACSIEYKNDYAITCDDNSKYGCMNLEEEIVIPFSYDKIESIKNDRFIVKDKDSVALVSNENKILYQCTSCNIFETLYLTHLVFEKDNMKGLLSHDGKIIAEPKYNQFATEKFGFVVYQIGREQGLIDTNGKELLDRHYERVEILGADDARVFDEKWVYIKIAAASQE